MSAAPATRRDAPRLAPARSSVALGLLVALAAIAPSALAAAQPQPARERADVRVELAVGERYVVPENEVASFSESGPGLCDVEVEPTGRIVVTARRPGTHVLLLIFGDRSQRRYEFVVRAPAAPRAPRGQVPGS